MDNLKLSDVFNDLPLGLVLINSKGVIDETNNYFLRSFGSDNKSSKGLAIDSFLEPSQKKEFADFLNVDDKTQIKSSATFIIINNKSKKHKITLNRYHVNSKRRWVIVGVVTESASESKLKQEVEKQQHLKETAQEKLEQESELNEMKSRFLSIASHEFRTPLAGILSSLNLMNRYLIADDRGRGSLSHKEKIQKHIDKIHESVKNLTTILNKFLALGNIEKGDIPVKYSGFNIKKTLEAQKSLFQQICKPGQIINYKHKGDETEVFLDRYLLKNILNNLLSNAIKFSPENTEIELTSIMDSEGLQLIVADYGIGIPRTEKKYIFRRFYRAKNALSHKEGTGLGLHIVKKYVELMEGTIKLKSQENVGTTVYISFRNAKKPK